MIGRHQSAGARHVLRHYRRIAGKVPADVAGNRAAEQVVGPARRAADHHAHGLARQVGFALAQRRHDAGDQNDDAESPFPHGNLE